MADGDGCFYERSDTRLYYNLGLIDKNIPLELRLDYLRLKNGLKLPRPKRNIIIQQIKDILKENGLNG